LGLQRSEVKLQKCIDPDNLCNLTSDLRNPPYEIYSRIYSSREVTSS